MQPNHISTNAKIDIPPERQIDFPTQIFGMRKSFKISDDLR